MNVFTLLERNTFITGIERFECWRQKHSAFKMNIFSFEDENVEKHKHVHYTLHLIGTVYIYAIAFSVGLNGPQVDQVNCENSNF